MSSAANTTAFWELLPESAKKGIPCPEKLEDGTVEEVGSKAAMPINMLRILFKKLTTDTKVPTAVRQGLQYFLYFIDRK